MIGNLVSIKMKVIIYLPLLKLLIVDLLRGPVITFQVNTSDSWDRHMIEGYGTKIY